MWDAAFPHEWSGLRSAGEPFVGIHPKTCSILSIYVGGGTISPQRTFLVLPGFTTLPTGRQGRLRHAMTYFFDHVALERTVNAAYDEGLHGVA